jgi:DNA-binding NtrC family response regulator
MSVPLRVLVVDDESSMLVTLAANLELEGMEIVTAASGALALELVKAQRFDLVLSDIRMPGMNGVELFRHIRKLDPDLPVVLMTAFAMESLVHEALTEGAFTVLPKPFRIEHVLATLLRAGRRPTVLVVDTEAHQAANTVAALQALGLRARAVFDGEHAVSVLREGSVDVCVVDLLIANTNGPDVLERLRATDSWIAFIAVCGQDVPELMRVIARGGKVDYMRKPVAHDALARTIALARSRDVAK